MARTTPNLAQLLISAMDSRLNDLHTAIPCKVESYDATTQTASVVPQIKNPIKTEDGEVRYEEFPVLPNLPVAFPRSTAFYLQFPLAKGDFGLVIFSERSIDEWRESGDITEPSNLKKHPLQGAIFLPMGYPDVAALTDGDGTNMALGRDGGANIKITPTDSINVTAQNKVVINGTNNIELNGNDEALALATEVQAGLELIRDRLDDHVHTGVTTGVGTSGPRVGSILGDFSNVVSDKVKTGSN